jgi:uncharacterized membrane protein (UPF0127 family)
MLNRLSFLASSLRSAAALGILFAVTTLTACPQRFPRVTLTMAGQSLSVEVARSDSERSQGLMGRRDLGPRDGMIFVFDRDEHLAFWMKDTPTPLSIAFVSSAGKILEITDMEPFSEKIIRSRLSARFALEMRKGAFSDLGVQEGDAIGFPAGFP